MGKSAGSAPEAPNPEVVIPLQGQENRKTFDYVTGQGRVNEYNPTGSVTWSKTPTFDEAGYNAALAKYSAGNAATPDQKNWIDQGEMGGYWEVIPGKKATGPSGAAPRKEDFTTYDWSKNTTLSPEQQKLYDANTSSQLQQSQLLQALGQQLSGTLGKPLDFSSATPWANVPGAAQLQTDRAALPNLSTDRAAVPTLQQITGNANLQNPEQLAINRGALTPGGDPNAYGRYNPAGFEKTATPDAMIQDRSGALQGELGGYKTALGGLDPLAFNKEAADAVYGQSTRYLDLQTQQEKQALESRLAEQGFVPGTPGYQRAMQNFMDSNARAYADARDRATTQGTSVGRDAFGSKMSAIQSQIAAALQGAGFGLTNDQARSSEALSRSNFSAGENRNAFDAGMRQAQFGVDQDSADFGRRNQAATLAAGLQQQDFAQQSSLADRARQAGLDANSIAQMLYQNDVQRTGLNNQTAQQTFQNTNQNLDALNATRQLQFGNQNANIDAANATRLQQQQANTNAGAVQNQTRAGQIAELLQQRQIPLNELNAVRSGTQVQMPGGSGLAPTGNMNPVDVMGAYNNQYQGQIDRYNAQVGSDNALMQTLGSLGGAAMGSSELMAALLPLLGLSDARLKEEVVFVGKTPGGHNVYEYDIFGRRERGVMAQEVQKTQPEAVQEEPGSGFLMVDYSKVR